MEIPRFQNALAKLMLYGVLIAAAIMLFGGVIFLLHHGQQTPGDHIFRGEPHALTRPLDIIKSAFMDKDPDIIQLGVLILLLNPLVRVAFAAVGYGMEKDRLYTAVSTIVFLVLLFSFFW
ncbi:MAG: DUF1634 domain-containing protein [Chthoniobacterales bacterium]